MTGECMVEMPRYKCHKEVHAIQIAARYENELIFEDPLYAPLSVDPKLFARYSPVKGDYYVVYSDGYTSISPQKVFEEGYVKV